MLTPYGSLDPHGAGSKQSCIPILTVHIWTGRIRVDHLIRWYSTQTRTSASAGIQRHQTDMVDPLARHSPSSCDTVISTAMVLVVVLVQLEVMSDE